jgi:hypothetical protein
LDPSVKSGKLPVSIFMVIMALSLRQIKFFGHYDLLSACLDMHSLEQRAVPVLSSPRLLDLLEDLVLMLRICLWKVRLSAPAMHFHRMLDSVSTLRNGYVLSHPGLLLWILRVFHFFMCLYAVPLGLLSPGKPEF